MYIVAFYSFRGGVGRSTALVNVGFDLVRRGRKVLLVDFDLDSPDLHSFPPLARPEPHPGMVEYISLYREKGESPNVEDYLYSVKTDGQTGDLWVMPAGRCDAAYWESLAGIDWQGLYDRQDGYLFFEDLRAQWETLAPDYVLIDTRSGVTPTLGIGTRQLADAVVMMFNPHRGNPAGLNEVSRQIVEESQVTGREPIQQFFVASGVVEADEKVEKDMEKWKRIREGEHENEKWVSICDGEYENWVGIFDYVASVPFSHQLWLGNRNVNDRSDNRLAQVYRRITNALIKGNFRQDRDGARVYLCEIHARPGSASGIGGRFGITWTQERNFGIFETIIGKFRNDAEIQAQAACCLYAGRRYDLALQSLDQAVQLQPESPELLWQRASYRSRFGMTQPAAEDLLHLIEVSTRAGEGLPANFSIESLIQRLHQDICSTKQPRFALPEGFEEEPPGSTGILPDYSDPLIHVSGVAPYVASALQLLSKLDPDKFVQVRKRLRLSVEAQRVLSGGVPHGTNGADVRALAYSGRWAELVELLRPLVEDSELCTLEDAIFLFLAWWGLQNEAEVQSCGKRVIERFRELLTYPAPESEESVASHLQIIALIYWKIGQRGYAERFLDFIVEYAWPKRQRIFSYLQCAWVVWERFIEDCTLLRQFFRNPLYPLPFLGRESYSR